MKHLRSFVILSLLVMASSTFLFALNPSRTYKQRPEKYNMEYTEVKVKTNDGNAELNVWDFPCKSKKTTDLVLIAHSGEGNMADYLRRVDQFRSDYNVVIFDWRGYGESSEFEIDNGMHLYPHFQDDYETMLDYCRKQHVLTFNVYGWGNLGGGITFGIGWSRAEVKKIIADTPFLSMENLEEKYEDFDQPLEVPFAGYEKRFEPQYAVSEVAPGKNLSGVLIIIGSNDALFKTTDYDELVKTQKKIIEKPWIVENPDQKDNFKVDKSAYYTKIKDFISQ